MKTLFYTSCILSCLAAAPAWANPWADYEDTSHLETGRPTTSYERYQQDMMGNERRSSHNPSANKHAYQKMMNRMGGGSNATGNTALHPADDGHSHDHGEAQSGSSYYSQDSEMQYDERQYNERDAGNLGESSAMKRRGYKAQFY